MASAWLLLLYIMALGSFRQAAVAGTLALFLLTLRVPPLSILKGAWTRVLLSCGAAWAAGELVVQYVSHSAPLVGTVQTAVFLLAFMSCRGPVVALPRWALSGVILLAVAAQSISALAFYYAAGQGDLLARVQLRHPTRPLGTVADFARPARDGSELLLQDGRLSLPWMEAAQRLSPLRDAGADVLREACLADDLLKHHVLAQFALLGEDLKIRPENRAVSLDYSRARDELAVLREHGELLLINGSGRRLHVFSGALGPACRVRATPDGAGFLCLFARGEMRYFGAASPYACTGEVKYGLGRAVDLSFDSHGHPQPYVLSGGGAVYRIDAGTTFTQVAPPLFPFDDQARGLVEGSDPPAVTFVVLDRHGVLHASPHAERTLRFQRHAFPAPDDDAVALRAWEDDLVWLDAWGGLHGVGKIGVSACLFSRNSRLSTVSPEKIGADPNFPIAYGDLSVRVRRGDCVDFVVIPEIMRVLILNGYGEVFSFDLSRYLKHPNPEPAP
ncbi:hypothetical protein HS125_19185 [bacterium]|nr:hypothetical protein [bacterium]